MRVRLLPFVIAGLISGGLSWWFLFLIPEFLYGSYVEIIYPGVVLALALLILGKVIGAVPSGHGAKSAIILILTAVAAQGLITESIRAQILIAAPIGYPQTIIEGVLWNEQGAPLFWLPSPVSGALQAFVIALGLSFAWQTSVSRSTIVKWLTLFGALFAYLLPHLTHLLLSLSENNVYEILSYAEDSSTRFLIVSWLLGNMALITSPLLWNFVLFLAIYMTIRLWSTAALSTDDVVQEEIEISVVPDVTESIDRRSKVKQSSTLSHNWVSTPKAIEILSTRGRITKRFTRILLMVGLFFIVGTTYHYYIQSLGYVVLTNESHKSLMQKHAAIHPLYTLWPAIKGNGCGGDLQILSDLLPSERGGDESFEECASVLLDVVDMEQMHWQASLDNETEYEPFSIDSYLLLRGQEPLSEIELLLRMCDVDGETLTYLMKSIEHGEPISEYGSQQLECIKDQRQRLQKRSAKSSNSDKRPNGSVFDYFYVHPHTVSESDMGEALAYWQEYRYNGNMPSSSFLKALNLSWNSRESIQQIESSDELLDEFLSLLMGDEWISFSSRDMQLLTPIVIDGVTQAIILSKINLDEVQGYVDDEWKSYYRIVTPAVSCLIVLFLWLQHLNLGAIPRSMDLMQWQAGTWHPSLVLLYRSNDFHHGHLFNILIFMACIVPIFYIGEPLMGAAALLLPLIFAMIAIPRVVAEYRLFAKGIPVPCKAMGTTVERLASAEYAVTIYEANYKGRKYHIAASYDEERKGPLVALIDPNRGEHGLLLNAFCESD